MKSGFLQILGRSGKLLALLLACLATPAAAHSDPWGDIHPHVTVKDGTFAISFYTSLPGKPSDITEAKKVYRMIFNADGRLIAPRHALETSRSRSEMGPVGLYGRHLTFGKSTVIFEGDQSNQPGYLLRSADGKIKRVSLPWPKDVKLSLMEDAIVVPDGIAITGKQDREILKFYWFPHVSADPPTVVSIGVTECIYHFPVASNLAFAGGRFWVAYMRHEEEVGSKLRLWSWKPGDAEARDEALDSPGFWNSHLSLAAVGDRLCLAYHCVEGPGFLHQQARIVTVFREAK